MMQTASRAIDCARRQWQRLLADNKGSAIALLAVLPVLAGAVAVGVETGQLYRLKRQMQGAADAAALAGAVDRIANKTGTVITQSAKYESLRNGFADGSNGVTVTVSAPPTSGPNVSTTGAVEVVITRSTSFSLGSVLMNWLGGTPASFDMRVRSVAAQSSYSTTTTSYEGCVVALTTANEQGISLGSFNNYVSDCTVVSNGGGTGSGSSASISISSFNNATLHSAWTRGSISLAGYNSISYTNAPQTSQSGYAVDPYASLADPVPGGCTHINYSAPPGSSITLYPGTYCGGLIVTNNNNVYFTAGTYYIANGDLVISSDNNVSCSNCSTSGGVTTGTTFVLTQTTGNMNDIGGVSITSQNNVSLNAPSTGTYKGVLFYQDRRVAAGTMSSTSKIFTIASLNNATLMGAIYFPQNRIDISSVNNFGGTSSTGCTVWIGRYIKFSSFNNNYKGGCATYQTLPVGIATTTTTTKGKVME